MPLKSMESVNDHECDEDGETEMSICRGCHDHASFCSICMLSGCCGAVPYELD